jgi:hypothetical protein
VASGTASDSRSMAAMRMQPCLVGKAATEGYRLRSLPEVVGIA